VKSSHRSSRSCILNTVAVYVEKRENPIVNRLTKTKVEREVDHEQERVDRVKRENATRRAAAIQQVRELPFVTFFFF